MSKLINNLLKGVAVGAVLYGIYKVGEKSALRSMGQEDTPDENGEIKKTEIDVVCDIIDEVKTKVDEVKKRFS